MLSNLTAEQRNLLQTMLPLLGLVADLTHGLVTVYLPSTDKKFLQIVKQEQPKTQIGMAQVDLTGRKVRMVEEPLVARVLQKNVALVGRREQQFCVFHTLKVFPLQDRRQHVYGALAFETNSVNEAMLDTCMELLTNYNQDVPLTENYARLHATDGVMIVDPTRLIVSADKHARYIFDVMDITEVVGLRTNRVQINWPLVGMVMDTGIAESKTFEMRGRIISIRVLPVVPKPKSGSAIIIMQDVTELKQKDEELLIKSVVIKEIHHRVKNNLQTIAGLLRLQARRAKNDETKQVLKDSVGRVNSIAIVHEYLSQQDAGMIDVGKVARGIYQAIMSSMVDSEFKLQASFSAEELLLPSSKATSVALILNELLQNAIEHAFVGRTHGKLDVSFAYEGNNYVLRIADDGIGLPTDFDINGRSSLGLKIIKTMAEADLQGSFTLENRTEGGTLAVVVTPQESFN